MPALPPMTTTVCPRSARPRAPVPSVVNFPIRLNNKLAALLNQVEGSETRPTDQSYDVYEKLSTELDVELQRLTIIIQQDVSRLNDLLRELGLPPINVERLIT